MEPKITKIKEMLNTLKQKSIFSYSKPTKLYSVTNHIKRLQKN